jgi:hypothetical protein
MSRCAKCDRIVSFQVSKQQLGGTGYYYNIVECPFCQTAIGVVGIYNTDTQLIELREAVRAIAQKIGVQVDLSTD